jgi:hypothetical protein
MPVCTSTATAAQPSTAEPLSSNSTLAPSGAGSTVAVSVTSWPVIALRGAAARLVLVPVFDAGASIATCVRAVAGA